MAEWQKRQILIWGKTRPELSLTYREVVCTGGVFEDSRRLVRLYPSALRDMDDEQVFRKDQWIEADVMKAQNDPRPESYRIHPDRIKLLGEIKSKKGDWSARADWIINDFNVFQSVEALQERQMVDRTSLGLVKPLSILDVHAIPYGVKEKVKFWKNYEDAVRQMDLPLDPDTNREIKPITPPDYSFKIKFKCDDKQCKGEHSFSVFDWEVDALYFKLRQKGNSPDEAADKVVQKLHEICAPDKDLYFFLGNIFTHPNVFTIVGLWWPKKTTGANQLRLFVP